MKICYLADAASIHTQRWTQYFIDHSHEVSIISLGQPETELKGIKTYVINAGKVGREHVLAGLGFNILQIKKLLKKIQPDVLHAHFVTGYGVITSFLGFHPLVISAWGTDVLIYPKESRLKKYLAKRALKKADLLHCDGINPWKAMEELGADSEKIVRNYFGIDGERFHPSKRSNEFRDKINVGSSPMIISLRNLNPIYDVESLVRAVPIVIKEVPEAKFVIAGNGILERELKRLAIDLGVSESINFTGKIFHLEVPYYIASADIYVSTSLSDAGLAASTGEAMACGLPVVITDDPDNRDWIKDGVNGFIVPVRNPSILAKRIVELIRNKSMRREFGRLNREIITERNDYNIEMGEMEKKYEELLQRFGE